MNWFCRLYWRSGELLAEDIAEAQSQHLRQVNQDIRGDRAYSEFAGMPTMKIKGNYCSGQIEIGDTPTRKARFDKRLLQGLDFEA